MALTNEKIFLRSIITGDNSIIKSVVQENEDRPGVYCIFNSESNMLYIGCSNSVRNRITMHRRHLLNGEHLCKQMSADYIKNKEAFLFFCIEYVDFFDYGSIDLHRSVLLNRETQYMKRVPHTRLYNNNIPVSMSEKMLMSDTPSELIKIHVSDIFRRLEMSPDSIRANGLSIQDEMTLPDAIDFVRKRTVANGRWPQEKAALAIAYLSELEGQNKPVFDSDSAFKSNSEFDYFGDYVVKANPVQKKFKFPAFTISDFLALAIYGHTALVWYEVSAIFGLPGMLAGVVVFAMKHTAVVVVRSSEHDQYTSDVLGVAFVLDLLAIWAHYTTFFDAMPANFRAQVGADGVWWSSLILGVIVAMGAFMALYFTSKTAVK